jgi:hypothetical protein
VVRYDRAIPPGGVGQVTLQVNTSGFQGKVTKSAQVTTNDHRQRNTKIYLSINVRPYIIIEPGRKIMLRGIVGEDIRRVIRIRPGDEQPLEITKVQTNLESVIDYKLNRQDDSNQYDLEVVSKVADQKTASGFLTLHTNHPKKKVVKLSVYLRIRPEIQVWPNIIGFYENPKSGAKGRTNKRNLIVVNNRGRSFKIKELKYNEEYFQVRSLAKNDAPASRYQFEVIALLDKLPAGRLEFRDTLTIRTDSARVGELKVPLSIRLKQQPTKKSP